MASDEHRGVKLMSRSMVNNFFPSHHFQLLLFCFSGTSDYNPEYSPLIDRHHSFRQPIRRVEEYVLVALDLSET